MDLTFHRLDEQCGAFYLTAPAEQIVFLQALFEIEESQATVRTLDREKCVMTIITTNDLEQNCRDILAALKPKVQWREVPPYSPT